MKLTVDYLTNQRGVNAELWVLLAAQLLLVVLGIVLHNFGDYARTRMRDQIQAFVRWRVAEHASNLDLAFYERPDNYDQFAKAKRDLGFRPFLVGYAVIFTVQQLASVTGFFIATFSLSPTLAFSLLLALLPALITLERSGSEIYAAFDLTTSAGRRAAYLETVLSDDRYAKDVRLLGFAPKLIKQLQLELETFLQVQWRAARRKAVRFMATDAFGATLQYGALAVTALQVAAGRSSIGDFTLMVAATEGVRQGISLIISNLADLNENSAFFNDLALFLEQKPAVTAPKHPTVFPTPLTSGWQLRNLTFSYPGALRPVFEGLDLDIPHGQITALVGVNGAGKSTLIKLLSRLYDPEAGTIMLSGVDIREFDPLSYRTHIGAVMQDFSRFHLTLQENVTLGRIDDPVCEQKLEEAIVQSGLGKLVSKLPDGVMTILGRQFDERGTDLSGGQWQRVALARALYRNAPLLLLDEPTSALDAEAERELFRNYRELMQDRTTLFVTHRLQTARLAHYILVMEDGKIVERGTHDELVARQGRYATLLQASQDFLNPSLPDANPTPTNP